MKKVIILALIASLTFLSVNVFAHYDDDDDFEEAGFSGMIQAGTIWTTTTSQLHTDSGNKKINTLDKEADRFDELEPGILFDLRYTYTSGTSIYISTPFEDEYELSIGVSQFLPDGSQIGLSAYYTLFKEVWKDPYMIGAPRAETDLTQFGCRLKYDQILGTSLSLGYKYTNMDVDEDLIGESFSDLKRDGDIHSLVFGYSFNFGSGHLLTPEFQYSLAAMDGKSNSYDGYKVGLNYGKMSEKLMIQLSVSAESDIYDKSHPIFNKKRKDKKYHAMTIFTWLNPFGFEKFFCNFGMEGGVTDSNINFFQSKDLSIFMSTGYNF